MYLLLACASSIVSDKILASSGTKHVYGWLCRSSSLEREVRVSGLLAGYGAPVARPSTLFGAAVECYSGIAIWRPI